MVEDEYWTEVCDNYKGYVIRNEEFLRRVHKDKYIAVKDCRVVDSDEDQFKLSIRVREQFPKDFVLISTIEDIVNPKRSPLESPEALEGR